MQQTAEQKFQNDLFHEFDKKTMPWDDNLREWYPIAMKALKFAPCQALGVSQAWYNNLLFKDDEGIRMSVVQILSNNMLRVTPNEMEYTVEGWADVLELNTKVAKRWNALALPIQETLQKRYSIMNSNGFGLKAIPKA